MANDLQYIYVGGQKYCLSIEEVSNGHCEKLKELMREKTNQRITINRPKMAFEAILDFHLTGYLHMPISGCPEQFKEELDYWDISHKKMERCCLTRLLAYFREKALLKDYKNSGRCLPQKYSSSPKSAVAKSFKKLWNVLNYHDDSLASKVYFFLSTCVIFLSILGVAISTLPRFRVQEPSRETVTTRTQSPTAPDYCKLVYESVTWMQRLKNESAIERSGSNSGLFLENLFPEPVHKKIPSLQQTIDQGTDAFFYIEIITTVFFTADKILRFVSCPGLLSYLYGVMNIVEILLLLASYCRFIIHYLNIEYDGTAWSLLLYIQMFRVVRIVRVMRHVTAFKVLNYSMKAGIKDLCVIILYIFIGLVIFSNLIFFFELSEDFRSIPDSWWWALITMTTVGYGDMIPKSIPGKVLGCICAVSGVIMLSLVIPIFVNTFLFLYQYAELDSVSVPTLTKKREFKTNTSDNTEVTFTTE